MSIDMKNYYLVEDYNAMSKLSASIISNKISNKPEAIISFTTGASPKGLFEYLVNDINSNKIDISKSVFLNLDEYIGPKNSVYTVKTFMYHNFYNLIKQKPFYIDMFNSDPESIDDEIIRYSNILKQYPRDIQLLGLGTNGHIGANEPGTSFDSTIFCADHEESTINSTMNLYKISKTEAPTQMLTMGFKEIMESEQPILIVSGKSKAEALRSMLEEDINPNCPASFLTTHPNFTLIADKDAAELLNKETLSLFRSNLNKLI